MLLMVDFFLITSLSEPNTQNVNDNRDIKTYCILLGLGSTTWEKTTQPMAWLSQL